MVWHVRLSDETCGVKVKWTCESVNLIGKYTICFYFYKVIDIVSFESEYNLWCNSDINNNWGVKIKSRQVYFLKELKTKNNVPKIPDFPSEQAICMRRHCKLYSGVIIEFQNFTIAPINQWMHCLFLFECTPTFILIISSTLCILEWTI
jgi:hypothetical protein